MKKVVIGFCLIIALLIVAVLLLPFLIDLNNYKDRYQPMIEEALNRKIVLNDLRLTIIPRIGVRIDGFTVMDDPAFSQTPFASLTSLDIGIKLMPARINRSEALLPGQYVMYPQKSVRLPYLPDPNASGIAIHDLATGYSWLYGVITVLFALFAGWVSALIFRRT